MSFAGKALVNIQTMPNLEWPNVLETEKQPDVKDQGMCKRPIEFGITENDKHIIISCNIARTVQYTNNDYFLELNIFKIFPWDFLDFLGSITMQLGDQLFSIMHPQYANSN